MEKAINTKTKKINVHYGFFGDINYGVDYPTLTENIELTMLFPYLNKGETDITEYYPLWRAVYWACKDIKKGVESKNKYSIYMQVRTLKYEPTIDVCFRIVENAA